VSLTLAFVLSLSSLLNCAFVAANVGYTLNENGLFQNFLQPFLDEQRVDMGFGMFRWQIDVPGNFPLDLFRSEFVQYFFSGNSFLSTFDWDELNHGESCVSYPDDLGDDDNFEALRTITVVGVVIGGVALLGVSTVVFFNTKCVPDVVFCYTKCCSKSIWWICRLALLYAIAAQSMTFLLFKFCSDGNFAQYANCEMGPGGILSAIALGFYLLSFALSCFTLAPTRMADAETKDEVTSPDNNDV